MSTRETIANAPRPWRVARIASELSAVCDAKGRSLGVVRNEIAELVVAAVNEFELQGAQP